MLQPSPAACGRGLKLIDLTGLNSGANVARRVRAWIETTSHRTRHTQDGVARRVRAWIETCASCGDIAQSGIVARRVRAWIETCRCE